MATWTETNPEQAQTTKSRPAEKTKQRTKTRTTTNRNTNKQRRTKTLHTKNTNKQTDRKTSGERQSRWETYPPTRWWMAVHQENPKTPPRDSGAGTDQDKVVWRAARNLIAPPPLDDLHCEGKGLDLRGRKKRRSEEIRERSEKKIWSRIHWNADCICLDTMQVISKMIIFFFVNMVLVILLHYFKNENSINL